MGPRDAFEQFMRQFDSLWGQELASVNEDMRRQIRRVAHTAFQQLDLVTREEFDVQCAVLARSRETLDHLEQTVRQLQQQLAPDSLERE